MTRLTLPPADPLPAGPGGQLATHAPKRCECCQKTRTAPNDIALFGTLTDCNGKVWDICGKCIQAMWRKRHPRPDKM